ncbi:hypothetical protein A0J57_20260 [Sphingobium sp. 22B]|uniref:hypothetical protein n=1 Tax=unclassified Sphingobium TaxID=2611147 RepID=UPI0007822A27|nr:MULTISPECIES: hypothetical protein [unclassified Sphingobium]KXU29959.1 hypothetical protein AXW74_20070 [Sphingobium sp. AM]KYC30459.1 hypothetical protein A0J57_20260 [Sphingobium sp. 22B]OAP30180.1 hypothetical protein A8O16_19565 [Sphingobium sp. 20006FA]
MMKTSLIAAMLLLGTASPVLAQQGPSVPQEQAPAAQAGSERVNLVIVYGDDPCPQSQGSDIVVCARKGEEERYRIPEPLRGDPNQPSHQAWGERVKSMEYVGRSGTESCSPVGGGGATGCFAQLARLAKAERQAADNASWKDLVEAERTRRLSTIDAESKAIEAQAVAEEKARAAQQQQPAPAQGSQQGTPPQQ